MKTIFILLFILTLVHCGDTALLKDPFRIQFSKFENKGLSSVKLASNEDHCSLLLSKRFYNYLFFLPFNSFSEKEINDINKASTIKIRYVSYPTDIFLTTLVFLGGFSTYSVDIEQCSSAALSSDDKNQKERIVEIPLLHKYSDFLSGIKSTGASDFFLLFQSDKAKFLEGEEQKLKKFVKMYKDKYQGFKILLLGHTDEGDYRATILLSLERAQVVKALMEKEGIASDKIHVLGSGSFWPAGFDKKTERQFNRRVDLVIMD